MRLALILALAALTAPLAGCATRGAQPDPLPSPSPTGASTAHFLVENITIVPAGGAARETIYEDDAAAIVRYVIRQPDDAPREAAFVTYLLNGRITDVAQVTLSAGEEKVFERRVGGLRDNRTIEVEVRAGTSALRASATVEDWPRAGRAALGLDTLSIRADYGLLERDGRALVNLTIDNHGNTTPTSLRGRLLCVDETGAINPRQEAALPLPPPGHRVRTDAILQDCVGERYGLEVYAEGVAPVTLSGRLLLVAVGWRPVTQA